MDMNTPPAIHFNAVKSHDTITIPAPKIVLVITPEGNLMRGDKAITDLSREELLIVVRDLVDVIRQVASR